MNWNGNVFILCVPAIYLVDTTENTDKILPTKDTENKYTGSDTKAFVKLSIRQHRHNLHCFVLI